jgi:hypothetical protein
MSEACDKWLCEVRHLWLVLWLACKADVVLPRMTVFPWSGKLKLPRQFTGHPQAGGPSAAAASDQLRLQGGDQGGRTSPHRNGDV